MEAILGIISGGGKRFRRDDDAVDRFHHRYTTILLAAFAAVSTTQQLVGEPIKCWAPAHYEDSWINYANAYCWVKNTYVLPFEEPIPKEGEEVDEIVYYQWIPFIFLGMAIFFFLPSLVWTSFNSKAGVDSDNILEAAENFKDAEKLESKAKQLKLITNQIDRFVGSTPKTVGGMTVAPSIRSNIFCICGRKFGNYLVILYIFTKLLYIGNIIGQLFALNSVLETDFNIFGIKAIQGFQSGEAFLNHTIFPKVTMCNFNIRSLTSVNYNRHTVQCLLPINLYTEKMFIFLWFWMVFVLFITICSLLMWIIRSAMPSDRYGFIENSLVVMERMDQFNEHDRAKCWRFVYEYLRLDGVFVLRMIGDNTNKITCSEIVASVWDNYDEKYYKANQAAHQTLDPPEVSTVDTMPRGAMNMKPMTEKPPKNIHSMNIYTNNMEEKPMNDKPPMPSKPPVLSKPWKRPSTGPPAPPPANNKPSYTYTGNSEHPKPLTPSSPNPEWP